MVRPLLQPGIVVAAKSGRLHVPALRSLTKPGPNGICGRPLLSLTAD